MTILRKPFKALSLILMTTLVISCARSIDPEYDASASADIQAEAASAQPEVRANAQPRAREAKAKEKSPKKTTTSWKPSTQANNNAVIKIGDNEELKPQAMDISVQIDGFRARVVIDGFYTNPHARNLEGSFKFRLPNGAVPYFFAFGETATSLEHEFMQPIRFDSKTSAASVLSPQSLMSQRKTHWLEPKEAIMVSKEKAAFAYNQTVARQVDPALLEWAGAGIFSAKVFPLMARKTHRVVLGYDLDLKRANNDLLLDLPLTEESIQKRINLLVNQKGASQVTLNRIINNKLRPSVILSKNNELVQETIEGTELNGIRVTIEDHANVTLVGDDEAGHFFAKQIQLELPSESSQSSQKAVFAIDTSLSASSEKFHLWVKLINQILSNNEDDLKEFALLSFSTDTHWWKQDFVENSPQQRKKLLTYLNQLILEGATDLGKALNESASPSWLTNDDVAKKSELNNRYDLFLLSDGAVTWGEKDPFFISESIKKLSTKNQTINQLYTYRLGLSGENAGLLTHLTREIGGASYQLLNDSSIEKLSRAHIVVPWTIQSVQAKGTSDILMAGRPKALYPGQLVTLTGRVTKQLKDDIILSLSKGNQTKEIRVSTANKIDSFLTARAYGQIAVNQLESIAALERKVASAYANHFRVPGQSSSLLMLESEADYKRYNISPAEDAYVVKIKQVQAVFNQLSEGFAQSLSDPKKRVLDQIAKLEKMTFIQFSMPDAVALMLEDIPSEAFALHQANNGVQKIDRENIPEGYLKDLKPESIKYDRLQKEANRRLKQYSPADALKVLSSLVEQMPSDVAILRDVAFSAESWDLNHQAYSLHLTAAAARPYEPQSYTYLAKLAHKMGNKDLALVYFEMGLASQWSNRFGDYALIHKIDYANFLRKSLAEDTSNPFYAKDYAALKLKTLSKEINLNGTDLIVAISWNTDRTDIDLHIVEPSGEECYYSHNKTRSNGYITADVTQGYGPEMYVNKDAPQGSYDLLVKYFSTDRNKLGLKTKVMVRTIKNWGTREESEEVKNIALNSRQEKQLISKIKI